MSRTENRSPWRAACLAAVASLLSGCTDALFALANAPTHFSSVRPRTDIAYGEKPRQRLDVYAPAQAKGLPVVVFWYGGAWTAGDKSSYRFVGTRLAENGFIAVLPDYRLYPAASFPAFVEDGARAIAWVERHIETFGGDPTRIVLMGHSAGAHQAAMLAVAPQYLRAAGATPADIIGLVGLSGPYVLDPDTDVLRTIFSSPYQKSDWQPVRYASAQAPPTLLLHGLDDRRVSPRQTRQFRDALSAKGVSVEMELYEDDGHADTVACFSKLTHHMPEFERVMAFIKNIAGTQSRASSAETH
jgi:acetyl esterase/lipase